MTRRLWKCCMLLAVGVLLHPVLACAQQGDPQRGEKLFVGSTGFSAGGAPCLACHGIAGHELGYAAGATYGPDLTSLFEDYGEEGVAAVLDDPSAFESMSAIFSERPLSENEIADLTAFFAAVANHESADTDAGFAGHVIVATGLLFVVLGGLGWRRFKAVRRPLVEQTRFGKGGTA